jgi:hypothetical protein
MLVPVALENQLGPNANGQVDKNARWDCVSASIAAACNALVGTRLGPGDPKDAAYGAQYTGATDPLRYSAFLGAHGVAIQEVRQSSGAALVATAKAHLAQGHPVYAAIPSQWGLVTAAQVAATPSIPTHAVMLCDASGGTLTAMNPWPVDGRHAFYQTMSEAWWASRLVYGHILPLSRTSRIGDATVTLTRQADNRVHDTAGHSLGFGMAEAALSRHQGSSILVEETYGYGDGTSFDSFALLSDGAVLSYLKHENVVREDRAAFVALAVLRHVGAGSVPVADLRTLLTQALGKLPAA